MLKTGIMMGMDIFNGFIIGGSAATMFDDDQEGPEIKALSK